MKRWTAGFVVATLALSGSPVMLAWGASPHPELQPGLTADANRDGRLTAADEAAEERWTDARGAIFLPNLDDDQRRCRVDPADLDRAGAEVDRLLAACNDAADDRINGPRDALDLAPLEVHAHRDVSRQAAGRLSVVPADKARIFVDGQAVETLTAAQLRRGVRVRLEGRDVVRDPAKWDGQVSVTLTVADRGRTTTDVVKLRVAPLMLQNELQRAETVLAARPNKGPGWPTGEPPYPKGVPGEWEPFAKTLGRATRSAGARLKFVQGTARGWKDMWVQDTFEPATASMPVVGGSRTMRILIRSGNVWEFPDRDGTPVATPRPAGRLLYRDLRGPDIGIVQELSAVPSDGLNDLLNMGGNIESLPPYAGYPHGRVVYGAESRRPDAGFIKLVTGQGYQAPVVIDTSWLMVGHADETTHVVRAGNARGWTLAVADPRLAVDLLREAQRTGAGQARLFADTNSQQKPTIDQVLADSKGLADNEAAAGHIDEQLRILLAATGLTADELVRLPVLFERVPGYGLLRARTPGLVNGLSLTARDFAAPDPHGPKVGGRDVFRQATERAMRRNGVRVHWVEDFFWAHLGGGEVHCATNALRDTRSTDTWWRSAGSSQAPQA
ncbi:protein-arginine deiminase family protein [Kribbella sp. CA-293567]|uniref:protein-arginine deiminase family protein n=1 Tax=Kribbella sp. CA-293567 TaxID=3002436 RepID=UPI0022DCF39A|nr:protein-arginine deiminase family protein [Kribbella sp. CA-293567]WBQ05630.1 protein-arginine deiminase family protein [Kribbella sp. CA-293567]